MLNLLIKLAFFFKQPLLIITTNKDPLSKQAISHILTFHSKRFKPKIIQQWTFWDIILNNVFLLSVSKKENLEFFIESAQKSIFLINQTEEISLAKIKKIIKFLTPDGTTIFNSDNQEIKEIDGFSFGFTKKANLKASDLHITEKETNFKIEYEGNIVPIWLSGKYKKKEIYSILAACGCALQLNFNLVEISQALKEFRGKNQ